jgi:hypothetical protein
MAEIAAQLQTLSLRFRPSVSSGLRNWQLLTGLSITLDIQNLPDGMALQSSTRSRTRLT